MGDDHNTYDQKDQLIDGPNAGAIPASPSYIGPQRGPKSLRAVEAESKQVKAEINSYIMPTREENIVYIDTGTYTKMLNIPWSGAMGIGVYDGRRIKLDS